VAVALRRVLAVDAKLVSGGRGEFTIWVDGKQAFDKATHGDFPTDAEAIAAVRAVDGI
jgi:predicted Rdx family selenoprotein